MKLRSPKIDKQFTTNQRLGKLNCPKIHNYFIIIVSNVTNKLRTIWGWNVPKFNNNEAQPHVLALMKKRVHASSYTYDKCLGFRGMLRVDMAAFLFGNAQVKWLCCLVSCEDNRHFEFVNCQGHPNPILPTTRCAPRGFLFPTVTTKYKSKYGLAKKHADPLHPS